MCLCIKDTPLISVRCNYVLGRINKKEDDYAWISIRGWNI